MSNSKQIEFKKPFRPRIGVLVIVIIVIYVIVLFISYISKEHVSIYEVDYAKITDNTPMTGVITRKEKLYTASTDGYVNYYNPSGNRIGVGNVVYTLDSTGNIADVLADIDTISNNTAEEIAGMRDVIHTFGENFDASNYSSVSDFSFDISNTIFNQSNDNLYSDLQKVLTKSGNDASFQKVTADCTGIISYTIDGMEGLTSDQVNSDTFLKESSLRKTKLKTNQAVTAGSIVYKMETSEEWSIIVPINQDNFVKLADKSTIRVTIKKDNISFNAGLKLESRPDGYYAILSTNRFMERYLNDRFIQVELNVNSAEGLKIPNSSILEQEYYTIPKSYLGSGGGTLGTGVYTQNYSESGELKFNFHELSNYSTIDDICYIPKEDFAAGTILYNKTTQETMKLSELIKLPGVYLVNDGTCKFVLIEKKYENAEYTIISDSTKNGLSNFDHIVVNPSTINENDFI